MYRILLKSIPALLAAAVCLAPAGQAGEAAEVPAPAVKKVVLYKHGIGYFERSGKVTGNATVNLAFRTEQMKDLLTSFFAVDLGGGKIGAVQYETRDPLSKQLEDILIRVPENNALSQFLSQLKGAKLSAKAAGETVSGRILGVEPITQVVDGKTVQHGFKLVLMADAGAIRALDLFSIAEFSLEDENLQRDLRRLLTISLDAKYTNRKKMTVQALGAGERELRIGYLIETPIWKSSYRVIFEKKAEGKEDTALLQGWALAENTTEEDWKDVQITFVAGNPLSYIMDLYSPHYLPRPHVPIPGLGNLAANWDAAPPPAAEAPQLAAENLKRGAGEQERARKEMAYARAPAEEAAEGAAPGGMYGAPAGKGDAKLADLLEKSMSTAAKGVQVGELFSYQGQEKVNIAKGQAAMVPILSQKVKGNRLLYYKAAFSPKPANAYVLKNDTDLTLEAGAVTFFEDDTALGESILSHTLAPGSQEILPYAIDGSVDVTPEIASDRQPAYKGKLADGILTLTHVESVTNTWKIANRGKSAVTLWIDQPKNSAFKLIRPEKALDEVENHYRFELPLKAGEKTEFAVEEKRDIQQTIYLANLNETQLRVYASAKYLDAATQAFLAEVAGMQAQKADLQRQINEWSQKTNRLSDEQNRLRNNMNSLRTNSPKEQELRAKWVDQLAGTEDEIVALRGKLDEAGTRIRQLDEDLAKKIRAFK